MGNCEALPYTGGEVHSENWKQILSKDGYQIPDTTKKFIRGDCHYIERIYPLHLTGQWFMYTVEERQRIEKLHNDYADLGQRVLNEAGKTDWNGVKEMLRGMLNEMRELQNGARRRSDKDWEPDSKNWKQILSRDEYQIPDTTKQFIRRNCQNIEWIYQHAIKFEQCYTEEEKLRIKKLHNDFKDLGQRVLNEAGNTDWNGVENMVGIISNKIQEIRNEVNRDVKVEDIYGNVIVARDVKLSDPVEKLLKKLERETRVPKHEIVLTCDGKCFEKQHSLKYYDVGGISPIIMLRKKQIAQQRPTPAWQRPPIAMMYLALAITNMTLATLHMALAVIHLALAFQPFDPVVPNIWELYRGFMQCAKYFSDTAALIFKCLVNWFSALLKDWTRVLTEKDLVKIAEGIGQHWEVLGIYLGLKQVQLDRIKEDNKDTLLKIFSMLTTWLNEKRSEATVGKLYQTMTDCKVVRLDWNKITSVLSDVCRSGI